MSIHDATPSTWGLMGEAGQQAKTLLAAQLALVKAEFGEKFDTMLRAVGLLAAAALLSIGALMMGLEACAHGLMALQIAPGWAYLAVAVATVLVAVVLALKAIGDLKPAALRPTRSIDQLNKSMSFLKGNVS